jgi:hypothetical protein
VINARDDSLRQQVHGASVHDMSFHDMSIVT